MTVKAKVFEFATSIDPSRRILIGGQPPLDLPDAWWPEHLVLAALARCVIASLRFHADRGSLGVQASAGASCTVTRREEDGRYALVDVECRLDVALAPPPSADELDALLAKAERDCFVGTSLRPQTRYIWRVNGEPLDR